MFLVDDGMTAASWNYWNPVRVIFEAGGLDRLGDLLDGERAVLVTTAGFRRRGLVARIERLLGDRLAGVVDDVEPNPDVGAVDKQGERLRALNPDMLIALGGGSAMDTAKGLARLLSQPAGQGLTGHFRDGRAFTGAPALPLVAIPTTAGTGAEVTPFGTIWDFERGDKHSVAGPDLHASCAVLDPDLTLELPRSVTVSSGLDAVSHALESAWNRAASPVTLGLSAQSLRLSLSALPRLTSAPDDPAARARMLEASLLAGLAISQTRTALAHSMSYPLTMEFGLPHGLACSFTLPALLRFNARADDGRLAELAASVGFSGTADFARGLESLFDAVDMAGHLAEWIPGRGQALALTERMFTPGRADNNLRQASPDDVRDVLAEALDAAAVVRDPEDAPHPPDG